ncbi:MULTISPECIES: FAD-dependent monooxygenase [unclassified Nocardioides]|uniref:FAD-dependent monooxygenase n=1 Tax=unclassified Nocardioides TaxID=2615069 RepID=UPI00070344A0|nr:MULTISPECIES: FAD-dependent monooxygenase [unclassified Nocardioides]KQZ67189.1 FAD-binding monooxygenase [Nocardioides sp. Root151]KRF12736.1 FAD-binding monooxygenase [Nocardioides sp. Soil796]
MVSTANGRVLISGASIAGPALAHWLHRSGYDVTVVELAPDVRPGGQAVDLRGAGRTVIERMGLLDRARELSLDQRGIEWVDAEGKVTVRMPADAFGGEGLISEVEILRGDLVHLLFEATSPHVDYRFGDSIEAMDDRDDAVHVRFRSGTEESFGLVVGADGLHSRVRRLAFGDDSGTVVPLGCYTAWFTAPGIPELDGWYQMHNAPGGRVASVRPGRDAVESKASLSFRSAPLPWQRLDLADQRRELGDRFGDLEGRVRLLVEASQEAPDLAFSPLGQVRMPHWTRGRTALVGDAGYCPTPLTGLGTSLALVGGYLLAAELAAAGGDHARAFRQYESRLRPYADACQQLPPGGVRSFAPMTRTGIRLQAASMRSMLRWPMRGIMERQAGKAADIDLPDFEQQQP